MATKVEKSLSFAQLKRDAMTGHMGLELLERYGKPVEERIICPVIKVETKSFKLLRGENSSWLYMPYASLVYYDGEYLKVYSAGLRNLTPLEKRVMDGWREISSTDSFKEEAMRDAYSDGSSTYYKEKWYFEQSPCPYLFGDNENKKYDRASGKVRDAKVKGACELVYKVHQI